MHHSDQVSQYCSEAFQKLLREAQITGRMSRKGNWYDKTVIASFFATLKKELIHQARYRSRVEAQQNVFEYLEVFYNRVRRHSALDHLSLGEHEQQTEQAT